MHLNHLHLAIRHHLGHRPLGFIEEQRRHSGQRNAGDDGGKKHQWADDQAGTPIVVLHYSASRAALVAPPLLDGFSDYV